MACVIERRIYASPLRGALKRRGLTSGDAYIQPPETYIYVYAIKQKNSRFALNQLIMLLADAVRTSPPPALAPAGLAAQLAHPTGEAGRQIGLRMLRGNAALNQAALRVLDLQPASRVLEIGMGLAGLARAISQAAPAGRYVGADRSALMVAEAARAHATAVARGQMKFVEADAVALPFGVASFERVLTVNTLYFWADPAAQVAEIRRVLAPGGRLVLAWRSEASMRHLPFVAHGFRLYELPPVLTLLGEGGFRIRMADTFAEPAAPELGRNDAFESFIVVAEPVC